MLFFSANIGSNRERERGRKRVRTCEAKLPISTILKKEKNDNVLKQKRAVALHKKRPHLKKGIKKDWDFLITNSERGIEAGVFILCSQSGKREI